MVPASAVVLELERHRLVELAQPADQLLEIVLALARYPDRIALDLRLDLGELVTDQLGQPPSEVVRQSALEPDLLADLVAAGGLDLPPLEDLERQVSPDRL